MASVTLTQRRRGLRSGASARLESPHVPGPRRLRRLLRLVLTLVLAPACASSQLHAQSAPQPASGKRAWVDKSDELAQILVEAQARFDPEEFSQFGMTQYDAQSVDLAPDREPRYRAAVEAAKHQLEQALQSETDPRVRQDLTLMIAAADRAIRSSALTERLTMPYPDVLRTIFYGIHGLLSEQVAPQRRTQALPRLMRYVGMAEGTTALTTQARRSWELRAPNAKLLRPSRLEVERGLRDVETYIEGIHELFAQYKIEGAAPALALLDEQLRAYAVWIRAEVLPVSRADTILPRELYALRLEEVGVDIDPLLLLRAAQLEFVEVRQAMQVLAQTIAKARGLSDNDYRAIIRVLKSEPIPQDQVEASYREVNQKLEAAIKRERIVTLPNRPMRMRLASPAENAAARAPHFLPPPLQGNTGEQGQFVLTTEDQTESGDKESFDDFNFAAVRWTLSAHEGRPGHELQFSSLIENGVSIARSLFAFNSVNVEGWALYAEAEALPYEPPEGQLIALQFRLLRAARAMLDPMLNLGMIERDQAHKLLRQDVCLSAPMTRQELDRYTFDMPGQATSYFYGYSRLASMRAEAELRLGASFDRMAFNDFVLAQGMLPPNLLEEAVRRDFIPAHAKPAPTPSGNPEPQS